MDTFESELFEDSHEDVNTKTNTTGLRTVFFNTIQILREPVILQPPHLLSKKVSENVTFKEHVFVDRSNDFGFNFTAILNVHGLAEVTLNNSHGNKGLFVKKKKPICCIS